MKSKLVTFLSAFTLTLLLAWLIPTTQADELEVRGLLESRPTDVIGDWVIAGQTFVADANTEISEEDAPLTVGNCAEVEYVVDGTINRALEIKGKTVADCDDDDDDDDGDDDDAFQQYGILTSFPDNLIGDWVIDGTTYTANANTEFEQEDGPFTIGGCVEVKYLPNTTTAIEIETEHDYKCNGNGGGGGNTSYNQTYGLVDSFPPDLVGTWVVHSTTYTATATTQFEQEDGPFTVGGCVEVKFVAATHTAIEISTTEIDDCGGAGSQTHYGLIENIPDGMIGLWQIGGQSFTSTATTELDEEDGPLVVGACAEVTYLTNNGALIATEIETEEAYNCNATSFTNEAQGLIESFPDALYGAWVVDGIIYAATVGLTEFDTEEGDFAIGACVEVEYYVDNGVNQAVEIETEEGDDCQAGNDDDDDDDDNSKLYATIDFFPADPFVGAWGIGGNTYTATQTTYFEQENGPFAVDACVEAAYDNDVLLAVETEPAYKCMNNGNPLFTAYGIIETLPTTNTLLGTWLVSGNSYQVNELTNLEEEHGFFAVGAYVEVEYIISGTTAIAMEIETHVAPNAGNLTLFGTLDNFDAADDWNAWTVDGTIYQADPAIEVGLGTNAPELGQRVRLNLYERNGTQFVTAVSRAHHIFLPVMMR